MPHETYGHAKAVPLPFDRAARLAQRLHRASLASDSGLPNLRLWQASNGNAYVLCATPQDDLMLPPEDALQVADMLRRISPWDDHCPAADLLSDLAHEAEALRQSALRGQRRTLH